MARKRLNAVEKKIAQTHDYKRVFGSEQGKRVLQDLMSTSYVMSSTFSVDPHQMAFREGQRSTVMRIIQILETSEADMHKLLQETHNANTSISE